MERNADRISLQLQSFDFSQLDGLRRLPQQGTEAYVTIRGNMLWIAEQIFRQTIQVLPETLYRGAYPRFVLSVCGGSGVGKTSITALLSYIFNKAGLSCCTISGDNYPRRIPEYNDAERLHIYREGGLRHMVQNGVYSPEAFAVIQRWQKDGTDADERHIQELPEFAVYRSGGQAALERYLGTEHELRFEELNEVIAAFKAGADSLWLKQLGRDDTALCYKKVHFEPTSLLIVEWTHGGSALLKGIDYPILLSSTPQETLSNRIARNRDSNIESAFTALVLDIEQKRIQDGARTASLIVGKDGDVWSYPQYCERMGILR